jgi:hypothetical protein
VNPVPFEKFFNERGISLAVARMWRQRHRMPVIRLGRRLYVLADDFEQWLTEHREAFSPKKEDKRIALPPLCRKKLAGKIKRIY